jgi:hypothetical protein
LRSQVPGTKSSISGLKLRVVLAAFSLAVLLMGVPVWAQQETAADPAATDTIADTLAEELTPRPPVEISAKDTPSDGGGSITVYWRPSPDDHEDGKVDLYRIMRAESVNGSPGEFKEVGDVPSGKEEDELYENADGNTSDTASYFYKVQAVNFETTDDGEKIEFTADSEPVGPVQSSAQWFDKHRDNMLVATLLLSAFIVFFIRQAQAGKELFIRKIAGMEAVDEAVGRATEMGRKIYYIFGLGDMNNMQTIASMSILGRVSEMAAEHDTDLNIPCCRSMVMVTAREVLKESYSKVGRPDAYNDDQVFYLTDDQFGFAAGVDGIFVREKPATIFFVGQFFAESLIMAETGNSIGAIQIAATAMPSQLPFFIAACDYTLIGEELFAASAYLSKEPKLLGSIKGQDIGKGVILVALILGALLETFGIYSASQLFSVR